MKTKVLTMCVAMLLGIAINAEAGLVSYYGFEGNGNDTAADYGINSGTSTDNANVYGTMSYTSGQVGQAANFSGGRFYVNNSADINLKIPDTFTMEAWINPSHVSGWQRLVLQQNNTQWWSYHFALEGSQLQLGVGTTTGHIGVSGGTVVANQWQHVAATCDGVNTRIYINGSVVGTISIAGRVENSTTASMGIGYSAIDNYGFYTGLMDELAIWDEALSTETLSSHYGAGTDGYIPEPATICLLGLGGLGLLRRRKRA